MLTLITKITQGALVLSGSPSEIGSLSLFTSVSRSPNLALHGFLNSRRSVTPIALNFYMIFPINYLSCARRRAPTDLRGGHKIPGRAWHPQARLRMAPAGYGYGWSYPIPLPVRREFTHHPYPSRIQFFPIPVTRQGIWIPASKNTRVYNTSIE